MKRTNKFWQSPFFKFLPKSSLFLPFVLEEETVSFYFLLEHLLPFEDVIQISYPDMISSCQSEIASLINKQSAYKVYTLS
jgi:hypothetical protein